MTDRQTIQWPLGARSAVALAFDLDGPTGQSMLDGTLWQAPTRFLCGGYGPFRALPRLLALLEQYGLPATFFVPGWVVQYWPDECQQIVANGHEVAHHGYRHERYADLSPTQQVEVIARSQEVFRNILGCTAVGFRTPTGDWSCETPKILLDEGFLYSSSLRDDDRPYRHVIGGTLTDLVELPARVDLDDYAYFAYARDPDFPEGGDRIAAYSLALDNYQREADGHRAIGGLLTTTFHPKISGSPGLLVTLERFFDHLSGCDDVWFARCADVARYWLDSGQPQPEWQEESA